MGEGELRYAIPECLLLAVEKNCHQIGNLFVGLHTRQMEIFLAARFYSTVEVDPTRPVKMAEGTCATLSKNLSHGLSISRSDEMDTGGARRTGRRAWRRSRSRGEGDLGRVAEGSI